jgi:hypothetical protein
MTDRELLELADYAAGYGDKKLSAAAAMFRKLVAEREADRAAMREALEALEYTRNTEVLKYSADLAAQKDGAAITHLRQRLSE